MSRWVKFWFNYGGSIHGLWKNRRYSEIKHLAMELPRAAWNVQQVLIDELEKDKVRLEFMIENPDMAVVENNGEWIILHNPKSKGERFKTPRDAIDNAMKESDK